MNSTVVPSRVTLKDVAARAGVSYQTVSKVLNGNANVAAATEALIWQVVDELGYRPNATARNLRRQASLLIGYSWMPERDNRPNPILDRFLSITTDAAEAAGYHILLFPAQSGVDETENYRSLIATNRVDGFILTTTNYDDPRIRLLRELDFPFVAFGRSNPEWSFPFVDVDGRAGVRAATQHLLAQGHQRIALLAWPEGSRTGTARANGFFEAMSTAGVAVASERVRRGESVFEAGYTATQALLALPESERPTAIVAVDDHLATGAMHAVQAAGLRVGPDVGITGFDDTPGVQYLNPPLTSVQQPLHEVGQQVVRLLIDAMQGHAPVQSEITLQPKLVVRASSLRQTP